MRLFFLPFGGGAGIAYRPLTDLLKNRVQTTALDLPGHGSRFSEPLLTSLDDMTDDLFSKVIGHLDEKYAFFGHSLGGYLSCLLTQKLRDAGHPLPEALFISSTTALSVKARIRGYHILSRPGLLAKIREMGGTPPGFFREPDLQEMFLPVFRADFQAVSQYEHAPVKKLDIPILHFCGTDEKLSEESLSPWQLETNKDVRFYSFPGGHFYLFEHAEKLTGVIADFLNKCK